MSSAPLKRRVLNEEYEWFTMFGELPDEDRVADWVLRKALNGGVEEAEPGGNDIAALILAAAQRPAEKPTEIQFGPELPNVREPLFCEAMDGNPYVRRLARAAIACEVAHGEDVEDPTFAGRHGLPAFHSVALHVLGFPQQWVRPPYKKQAARLFARQAELRKRIPSPAEEPDWSDVQVEAVLEFYESGALPDDELRCLALLAHVELNQIIAHKKGRDVREAMALLDVVARREGAERDAALAAVCAIVREGRLP